MKKKPTAKKSPKTLMDILEEKMVHLDGVFEIDREAGADYINLVRGDVTIEIVFSDDQNNIESIGVYKDVVDVVDIKQIF